MESEFHQFLYISEFIATFWITKVNLLKILIVIWLQLSHEGILFSSGYLNFLQLIYFFFVVIGES